MCKQLALAKKEIIDLKAQITILKAKLEKKTEASSGHQVSPVKVEVKAEPKPAAGSYMAGDEEEEED